MMSVLAGDVCTTISVCLHGNLWKCLYEKKCRKHSHTFLSLLSADIIAFTIPKVFQMYQKEIESFKKKLTDKYNDFHSKYV